MTQCSAVNCKNKGVHAFPKDRKRRKAWENALRIKNFKAKDTSRLCSMHFKPDDYYGQSKYTNYEPKAKFLKKTAVPSIFSYSISKLDTPSAIARQQRLEKRCQKKLRFEEYVTPSTSQIVNNEVITPSTSYGANNEDLFLPNSMEIGAETEIDTEVRDVKPAFVKCLEVEVSTKATQIDMEHVFGTIHRFKNDDKAIQFYTGFECYKKFFFVYSTLSPMAHKIQYFGSCVVQLSTEDQFFLTIMKLRQNKCIFELSRFFNISTTTVSNIFITWVNFMYQLWTKINVWPSRDLVKYYMPEHFKNYNSNVRVILDGTEFHVQKPKNPTAQQASWSSYKHANTLKVLVGATPGGLLSYCSPAYAGSVSDRQTVERSDLVDKCESGDCILADRGFNIQDMFADKNVAVNIPTFLKGKTQLPGLTVLKDRTLASKRVHIERLIGLAKTYKILKSEMDHSYVPIAGAKPVEKLPPTDVLQRITGAFGKYQLCLCILIFLTKFPVAFHQMAILFLAPKLSYTCPDTGDQTCPCPNPEYDRSIFSRSMTMEWDLICDKKWLTSFTQTLFQLGTLLGSVLFGMASDRFGRKKPMLLAVVIQVTMGIAAAFVPGFWEFTFLRFLVGMSVGGTMVTGFVIVMEFVGTQYRDVASALYQVPFNMGHMLLPVFGYFFRDYSNFQLAISIPTVVLLSYFFLIPETPRWLIAVKRTEEAVKILERVAKVNKRPTEMIRRDIEEYQAALLNTQIKKGNIVDLFRTPNIRKNILAMAFNWLTCSYCFYGVSQYVGQLSGNAFINVAASAGVTLLGSLCSIPLMKVIGRRTILIIFNFICAFCLFVLAVIPAGPGTVVCASIGVVSSFIVFVVVYLYCTELFPTVVRNAALGFSSMMARVGSMIAPFVIASSSVGTWVPPVLFAIMPLIAGFVAMLLPETKGCELMSTIEEGEQFGKKITK